MDDSETVSVEITAALVEELSERAQSAGFDTTNEYVEYILSTTVAELDPVEDHRSEQEVESRLESLGYLK